jgi:hypothetical protein
VLQKVAQAINHMSLMMVNKDFEMDADDMRDYLDQNPDVPPTSTANPYARFLADLPDWSDLSQT